MIIGSTGGIKQNACNHLFVDKNMKNLYAGQQWVFYEVFKVCSQLRFIT